MYRLLLGSLEEDSRNEDGHDGEDDGGEVAQRALRVGGVDHRAGDAAVQGAGFRVQGSGSRVQGSEFQRHSWVQDLQSYLNSDTLVCLI